MTSVHIVYGNTKHAIVVQSCRTRVLDLDSKAKDLDLNGEDSDLKGEDLGL